MHSTAQTDRPAPEPPRQPPPPRPVMDVFRELATIDRRSLGIFRIALAALLLLDAAARWPDLEAFYAATGTLPLEARPPVAGGIAPSLLDWLPSLPGLRVAFCLGMLAYLLLGLGLGTRFATLASFVFLASLLNRNPTIRDGGDVVRVCLLAWALFLPVGARFSLDEWRHRRRSRANGPSPAAAGEASHTSVAALGILLQVGLIYLFAALAKSGSTWRNGTAVHYALHVDELVTPLGAWLRDQPVALLRAMTHATWALELAALPLLMIPLGQPWLRRAALSGLAALHVGIALTMRLALFEATMLASCLLFLTGADWRALARLWARVRGRQPPALAPAAASIPSSAARGSARRTTWVASNVAAATLLILVAIDGYNRNVARPSGPRAVEMPAFARRILEVPQLIQDWHMFAPNPYQASGRWEVQAATKDGNRIDPLTGGNPRQWATSNSRFWSKYLSRLPQPGFAPLRGHLARFLTERHNRSAPEGQKIAHLSLLYLEEPSPPPGHPRRGPVRTIALWPVPGRERGVDHGK